MQQTWKRMISSIWYGPEGLYPKFEISVYHAGNLDGFCYLVQLVEIYSCVGLVHEMYSVAMWLLFLGGECSTHSSRCSSAHSYIPWLHFHQKKVTAWVIPAEAFKTCSWSLLEMAYSVKYSCKTTARFSIGYMTAPVLRAWSISVKPFLPWWRLPCWHTPQYSAM